MPIASILNAVVNKNAQFHVTDTVYITESFGVSMVNFPQEKSPFMQEFRIYFNFKVNPSPYFGVALPSHNLWFALQSLQLKLASSKEVSFDVIWCSQNVGWTAGHPLPSAKPCVPRATQNLFKNFTGKRNVENFLKCGSLYFSEYMTYVCRNSSEMHRWTQYIQSNIDIYLGLTP